MSCLILERAKELISSFKGPLIIAMHTRGDNINGYFEDILEYIKSNKDKKYNIIALDVSNMPELCADLMVHDTPCIILFVDGELKYRFSSYANVAYIETMTDMISGNKDRTDRPSWLFGDDEDIDEEEDEEFDF